jgi:hypothetical protein
MNNLAVCIRSQLMLKKVLASCDGMSRLLGGLDAPTKEVIDFGPQAQEENIHMKAQVLACTVFSLVLVPIASPAQTTAQITSPTPGTPLTSTTITFSWNATTGADGYWLDVGTMIAQGNICASGQIATISFTCSGIPTTATIGTIYVQLYTHASGIWLAPQRYTYGPSSDIKVRVFKASQDCDLPAAPAACQSTPFHRDQAGSWTADKTIKIIGVNIPEQSEIAIYTDIEMTTAPQMYLTTGQHIFRVKYAGPSIVRNPPCPFSFSGSNITTTNMVFPSGYGITIAAGTPIYVHMDVKNWSPYEITPFAQDSYIYYIELSQ